MRRTTQPLTICPWNPFFTKPHSMQDQEESAFDPDIPVILHLLALTTTMDTDTISTLFVIQEGRHCMPTTDYYFMNIQPDPITIPPHRGNNSDLTAQHTATKDQIPQQMHPLRPGKTRVYPSMLADKHYHITGGPSDSISVITFVFYGRRQSITWQKTIQRKRRYLLITFLTVNLQRKKQISIYVHPKRKDYTTLLKDLHKPHK